MHCIHCGKEIPEAGAFCASCGKPVAVQPTPPPIRKRGPQEEQPSGMALWGGFLILLVMILCVGAYLAISDPPISGPVPLRDDREIRAFIDRQQRAARDTQKEFQSTRERHASTLDPKNLDDAIIVLERRASELRRAIGLVRRSGWSAQGRAMALQPLVEELKWAEQTIAKDTRNHEPPSPHKTRPPVNIAPTQDHATEVNALVRDQKERNATTTRMLRLVRDRYVRSEDQADLDDGVRILRDRASELRSAIRTVTFDRQNWPAEDRARAIAPMIEELEWAEESIVALEQP